MRRSIIALIGFGLASLAAPVAADPLEVHIPVTSADLASREAVADLYKRVNDAATSVCREMMRGSGPDAYPSLRACRLDRVEKAVEAAGLLPVSRYHAEVQGIEDTTTLAAR